MKLCFIDQAKKHFPAYRLCRLLGISQSGYFAWRGRPMSPRQRDDTTILVHTRAAYNLSHETYGSPRMVHELREQGFAFGRRRIARLMKENGMYAHQKRRFKRTTDSHHAFPLERRMLASARPRALTICFVASFRSQVIPLDRSML